MSCLTHDKRFRSALHSIINELRNENRTSTSVLRTMPKTCCTCADEITDDNEILMTKNDHQIVKLKDLIERIQRNKQIDTKLILSLNRFVQLIEQNRTAMAVPSETTSVQEHVIMKSASDSEDDAPMDTSRLRIRGRKKDTKTSQNMKPIKSGTFVFLPYKSNGNDPRKSADIYLNMARTLQRNRFLARHGPVSSLESKHQVRVNMITKKTSDPVLQALENAKKSLNKLTIHDKDESLALSETQPGEWVLIRPKNSTKKSQTVDMDKALDDLTSQWEKCFTLGKRGISNSDDDDGDNEEGSNISAKKIKGHTRWSSSSSSSSSSSDDSDESSSDPSIE